MNSSVRFIKMFNLDELERPVGAGDVPDIPWRRLMLCVPRQQPRKRDEPQQYTAGILGEHIAHKHTIRRIDPTEQASSKRDHLVRQHGLMHLIP
jgi:hypothetical protein